MGTLYRVKSDNYWAAAEIGANNQWIHIDSGNTGRTTITPANVSNGNIKPLILQSVTVNNSGSSGTTTVSDSARGVIAALKTSIQEKDYHYSLPLRGSLVIDNASASDLTIVYNRD